MHQPGVAGFPQELQPVLACHLQVADRDIHAAAGLEHGQGFAAFRRLVDPARNDGPQGRDHHQPLKRMIFQHQYAKVLH
ncbi:hypothetical protein D3C71_1890960 [compost metagenome]